MTAINRVLIAGATGRTGRYVVEEAAARGLTPVALARDADRARATLPGTEIVTGDLTDPGSLADAVRNVDGIVFVHGSDGDSRPDSFERIDYGGVLGVLRALGDRHPRIVLMTTFFITHRDHFFNEGGHALDWKRRSERLVRASGAPYTIVRPGWLDTGPAGEHVDVEQGDAVEGAISRSVLARVLVEALLHVDAVGKTFEVFSGPGAPTTDFGTLFAGLRPDAPGALDAVDDDANLPQPDEPRRVTTDLAALRTR
ncbi:SDR family oxidoreductase [Streptomyces seoulensis]|uniref:SDR family oxidoreductase n=1 Tax=Streptomyces seoulensis TaxID=73044 RepID=UPI003C2FF6A0